MRILITCGAGFIGSHVASHYQGAADIVILEAGLAETLAASRQPVVASRPGSR